MVKWVDEHLDECIKNIQTLLKNHTYQVGKYHTCRKLERGKERILFKLPYYPDRIIQWAFMLQIEKYFKRVFTIFTCASMPGRGIHYAADFASKYIEKYDYYLQIDIRKFYHSINHTILKQMLRRVFKDKELLLELDKIIDSSSNNDLEKLYLTSEEREYLCKADCGVPIGSYLSQYLANFYLAYFDHWLKEECRCAAVVRYADDVVIFSNDKNYLHNLLCAIKFYVATLELKIKANYKIAPTNKGLNFVGYRFFPGYTLLKKATFLRFKDILLHMVGTINMTQYHQMFSILGWLKIVNCFNFVRKYIETKVKSIAEFTVFNIRRKDFFILPNIIIVFSRIRHDKKNKIP